MTEPAEDTALFPTEPFASRARQIIQACPETPEGVVREVFDEDVYHLRSTDVRGKIVVDLGANVGAFSLAALESGARQVIACEPCLPNIVTLTANESRFGAEVGRLFISPLAITDREGTATLTGDQGAAFIGSDPEGQVCQTTTLAKLFALCLAPSEEVGFLKLDVEGSESLIFGAPDIEDALSRIEHIAMEFHEGTLGTIIPVLSWYHHVEVMGSDRRGGYVWARRYGL